jgi:hypothetical protein
MNVGGVTGSGDPPGADQVCVFVVGVGAFAQAFAEELALDDADALGEGLDDAEGELSERELSTRATTATPTSASPATTAAMRLRR